MHKIIFFFILILNAELIRGQVKPPLAIKEYEEGLNPVDEIRLFDLTEIKLTHSIQIQYLKILTMFLNFLKEEQLVIPPMAINTKDFNSKRIAGKLNHFRVTSVKSSFFENENVFPKGSVKFDNALLMTQINHEWHSVGQKSKCM